MQADAIPDWVIYLFLTPFFPIAGLAHGSLGAIQCAMIVGTAFKRSMTSRIQPERKAGWIRAVYLPLLILPNTAVVIWGILTDPAL